MANQLPNLTPLPDIRDLWDTAREDGNVVGEKFKKMQDGLRTITEGEKADVKSAPLVERAHNVGREYGK